ncbi:cell wall-active antibiotics response protein [Oceanobacillus caeni]|uniref:cell wall-active antibiotics response protein n=1 Tax=Oceanobacillus caeni TaxID=405946 RepID=UPI00214A328E|nr:cell wall-active antibiotics response protein [Oceanobacillus caeni]MCR1834734.1 cell wall-active antibiotics response protein [Oceanobacillus caeni]
MSGRIWVGLFFLIFGFGFLLHQADIIDMSQVLSTWWPLILIIIGIIQLINRTLSCTVSGFLFLLVGVLFFINQWFDLHLIFYLWPLIFIFIGFVIILTRAKSGKTKHTSDKLSTFLLFSGAEIKSQSKNFQGGSVVTIMGGVEIDLRDAVIAEGAMLDFTSILGGISIIVSENVQVEISGIPILGGWEDSTRKHGESEEVVVLKLNCLTILGGVEIRN